MYIFVCKSYHLPELSAYLKLFIDFRYAALRIEMVDNLFQGVDISSVVRIPDITEMCAQKLQDLWEGCFDITDLTL